jgi:NAD(P)-dependent dehydrogenase (short-subunit alcohol dehydrogenase family)
MDMDEAGLGQLEETLSARGQSIRTRRTDVRDEQAVEANSRREVFAHHGKVNLLFNNAGVLVDGKSWERPLRDWRWSFDVNVFGIIHGIRSFVPRMLAQGASGRVVNTSSQGGLLGGGTFMGPYQASKHAVAVLTETLYAELELEAAPITASCLCPGEVATAIWDVRSFCGPEEERNRLASESERAVSRGGIRWPAPGARKPDEFAAQVFAAIEAGEVSGSCRPGEGFQAGPSSLRHPPHRGRGRQPPLPPKK